MEEKAKVAPSRKLHAKKLMLEFTPSESDQLLYKKIWALNWFTDSCH
jgi:hypothetical protein